jgi:hypothetical protein
LLAKELIQVINDPSISCVTIAERIYDCQFGIDNPLELNVSDSVDLSDLEKICKSSGITIEKK